MVLKGLQKSCGVGGSQRDQKPQKEGRMTGAIWIPRGFALLALISFGPERADGQLPLQSRWKDSSPHRMMRVAVAPEVELEVLVWGGSGSPLVFLAGFGNSAHVFDGFAPEFVLHFRVLGITRRGFGASSKPTAGYDTRTLVRDIIAVLDSLRISRAAFVAHSFGGSELNYLAAHFPQRVDRLVYLDAAADFRQFYDSRSWWSAFPLPQPPSPAYAENDNSITAWRFWAERMSGPAYPESEIRSMYRYTDADTVIGSTAADSLDRILQRGALPVDLRRIRTPALAIYAVPGSAPVMFPFWNSLDAKTRAMARKSYTVISSAWRKQIDRVRRELEHVRIREIPGARHYLFLTHAAEVQHEMLEFLLVP
jgi:pimeloyl-ACP methyl ester carboxylesterase